ncbi:hypothetical protein K438DRAFT_1871603 [Mycena galopus ATCC 62051]|nr:hypothetical protein K438DRAFT_1871603 [Mycena galopus ATCC 62051]
MLVLLKPWRDLGVDLKATNETWSQAFDKFLASANPKVHDILAGIQYFYSVAGPNTFEDPVNCITNSDTRRITCTDGNGICSRSRYLCQRLFGMGPCSRTACCDKCNRQ